MHIYALSDDEISQTVGPPRDGPQISHLYPSSCASTMVVDAMNVNSSFSE